MQGAYNRIFNLYQQEKIAGVVTASAGNHAQGVALAAKQLGLQSIVVMPVTTPAIKVNAVNALGGQSVLHGDNYDEAYQQALLLSEQQAFHLSMHLIRRILSQGKVLSAWRSVDNTLTRYTRYLCPSVAAG